MRVGIVHVGYRQYGGEDAVVSREARLLAEANHDVSMLRIESAEFDDLPRATRGKIALSDGSHEFGRAALREFVIAQEPDVVHFHNLYPMLGWGAVSEAQQLGYATVMTVHNHRLTCVAGTHFRGGIPCELCNRTKRLPGVVRGCYRNSRIQSAIMSRWCAGQWGALDSGKPDVLLCVSEFMRDRLASAAGGRVELVVKENTVQEGAACAAGERNGACFVGRLSQEKGIVELLRNWGDDLPTLRIFGGGPLEGEVRALAEGLPNVQVVGQVEPSVVSASLSHARACIIPSVCFEGLPMAMLEASSHGTPVVAFDHGGMQALRGIGGALVEVGDFPRLVQRAATICRMEDGEWSQVSDRYTALYRERWSDRLGLRALEEAYRKAIELRQRKSSVAAARRA